ncbi:MAG: hypothetical protein D6709_08375 [Chloroflexi bacterium]|uniref:Penicillin-binding protein transpeptidase domain-containing protein n=1 Tax=Candidatus Thermofonsia Clade 3 bacterium TaxID=2364212 RepID=A0A2M8QGT3_9CHLR|nr:penicillin-binding transpeptidase domain-containing protein [Candidatus Roseilinea sp. NK_OTU-006]PJF49007.1 MAG: hypothetical protein CUN48_00660 [Candidatus Thermofonsia Clade 3 bacterium]RMG63411.1 MAG: hypothetical protein D6709_08375 [Chloroflexota bacterium]
MGQSARGRRGAARRRRGCARYGQRPLFSSTQLAEQIIQSGTLLNCVTQGQYPPGSTFKMATLAASVEEGKTTLAEIFRAPGFWDGYGTEYRKLC